MKNDQLKYDFILLNKIILTSHEKYGQVFKFQFEDQIIVCTSNQDAITVKTFCFILRFPKVNQVL